MVILQLSFEVISGPSPDGHVAAENSLRDHNSMGHIDSVVSGFFMTQNRQGGDVLTLPLHSSVKQFSL